MTGEAEVWSKIPNPPADSPLHRVHNLLHPRNIAFVGASDRANNFAARIHGNLLKVGYVGNMYPINPRHTEMWGGPCFNRLDTLPESPDHVLVVVPAPAVPAAIREAADAGARSATIITAGFQEMSDDASEAVSDELKRVLIDTKLPVTGPNCLGNLSADVRLFTNIDRRTPTMRPGGVAAVGQSGGLVMLLRELLEYRGIDLQFMVTTGNESGLKTSDFIEYCAWHPSVKVICVYSEGIHDRQAFLNSCRAARETSTPIVMMKAGASEAGQEAAMAHTGALAGSAAAFDALAREAGVLRVESLDDIVELAECFVHGQRPSGRRLAVISGSGGKRAIFLDAAEELGLDVPPLSGTLLETMSGLLGPGCAVGNPLDAGFAVMSDPTSMPKLTDLLYEDAGYDLLLQDIDLAQHEHDRGAQSLVRLGERVAESGKPIFCYSVASYPLSDYARNVRRTGPNVAMLQGVPAGLRALKSYLDYWEFPDPGPNPPSTSSSAARAALETTLAESGRASLSEAAAADLLSSYGVPITQSKMAVDEDHAVAIAEEIGFPVVAKVVSDAVQHKSDVGGVVLDLYSADEVRSAYRSILANVARVVGRSQIQGVLIAERADGEIELLIGGLHDPEVGPLVMFGSGGVDVEVVGDTVMGLAPLDDIRARTLIAQTKVATRLGGYRGRPPVKDGLLVQAIVAVGNLIADAGGRIASIDVNPFLMSEHGGVAVDALIVKPR